jgi:hypothetical protein
MKSASIVMKMLNKSAMKDSTIVEDFSNPRVGMKMKLHTKLANHLVTTIGELVLMINKVKDISFLRVMENLFPIVLNGRPVMEHKAQLRIVYFFQVVRQLSSGMIITVQINIRTAQFANKSDDSTELSAYLFLE